MLKLLSKNEITKAQNEDKAKEIQEGLKLSRKVDSLRELKAKEEQALEKFRKESLEGIFREITKLSEERDTILQDVKELRTEKARGINELNVRRDELDAFEEELGIKESVLNNKIDELSSKEKQILETIRNSNNELERNRTHREEAQRLHLRADEDYKETQRILSNAKDLESKTLEFRKETEKELGIREAKVLSRESDCKLREKQIKAKEKEQNEERIRLVDQRQTLERAMKRTND